MFAALAVDANVLIKCCLAHDVGHAVTVAEEQRYKKLSRSIEHQASSGFPLFGGESVWRNKIRHGMILLQSRSGTRQGAF